MTRWRSAPTPCAHPGPPVDQPGMTPCGQAGPPGPPRLGPAAWHPGPQACLARLPPLAEVRTPPWRGDHLAEVRHVAPLRVLVPLGALALAQPRGEAQPCLPAAELPGKPGQQALRVAFWEENLVPLAGGALLCPAGARYLWSAGWRRVGGGSWVGRGEPARATSPPLQLGTLRTSALPGRRSTSRGQASVLITAPSFTMRVTCVGRVRARDRRLLPLGVSLISPIADHPPCSRPEERVKSGRWGRRYRPQTAWLASAAGRTSPLHLCGIRSPAN